MNLSIPDVDDLWYDLLWEQMRKNFTLYPKKSLHGEVIENTVSKKDFLFSETGRGLFSSFSRM